MEGVRSLGVAAIAGIAAFGCGKTSTDVPPLEWHVRIAPACAAAKAENKRVLVYWYATWDVASKELEVHTFVDGAVRAAVRRDFVPLRVDRTHWYMAEGEPFYDEATREAAVASELFPPYASKYGSLVVVDPDCKTVIGRVSAKYEPREFLHALRTMPPRGGGPVVDR